MASTAKKAESLTITAPNMKVASFKIVGEAPYVQNAFSQKARDIIHETQASGSTAKKGSKKEPKDFEAAYKGAQHISDEGWHGIPAGAFRNAMISACRIVGFKMTVGKLSVFVEADGFDANEGTPLVKITKGKPKYCEHHVRNATGVCDLRARAMWNPGWEAVVRVRFDADQFKLEDVANLMMRVGQQVGIGEGRPDSKQSCGMGWGIFKLAEQE